MQFELLFYVLYYKSHIILAIGEPLHDTFITLIVDDFMANDLSMYIADITHCSWTERT
jgi:hypothetical protein